jgi:hypothetical protein
MTETLPPAGTSVWDIEISIIRACFGFRVSIFGFPERASRFVLASLDPLRDTRRSGWRFRQSHEGCRIKERDPKALEVTHVEGQQSGDPVTLHGPDKAGVVRLEAPDFTRPDQSVPGLRVATAQNSYRFWGTMMRRSPFASNV